MARTVYEVPLVTQAQNPICWVCGMAMVASERLGYSVGVGNYANGFDPSSASIPNLYSGDLNNYCAKLDQFGFTSVAINPTASELESVLQNCGPIILSHFCAGFPYGGTWPPVTTPGAAHAVVITGMDTAVNGGTCWMNNPWGDKDRPIATSSIIAAINQMQAQNARPVAYYRQ